MQFFLNLLCGFGLCVWRDLYRAMPDVTRGLGFCGLGQNTAPFSRLFARGTEDPGPHGIVMFWPTSQTFALTVDQAGKGKT